MVTDVAGLAARVAARRRQLDREVGRAQQVVADGEAAEAAIAELERLTDTCAKTAALLTTFGEQGQEGARAQFEAGASRALQMIFGTELSFGLVPGESGGQPTLVPVIRSVYGGTITETSVLDARGGGMAAVVGFVTRLVMLQHTPGARRVLFLDESFGMAAKGFEPRIAEFLRMVADQAGVQIVLVTHSDAYSDLADTEIRLELGPDGLTRAYEGRSE